MPERFIEGEITGGSLKGVKVVIGPIPPYIDPQCDTVVATEMCGPVPLRFPKRDPERDFEIKPRSQS